MRDQPIRPDVPVDMSTCATNHTRIYFDGPTCPWCELYREYRQEVRDLQREATAEIRDMQRGGGRW